MKARTFILTILYCLTYICSMHIAEAKIIDIKIISLNIRSDRKSDSINQWNNRKTNVIHFLKKERPDILCMQEVLDRQLKDLSSIGNEYVSVGVARDDGKKKGEYTPIIFNSRKFDLLDSETFWLSERPQEAGSIGWDGKFPRIATWVILREKKAGRTLLVVNTHLDNIGKEARKKGIEMVLNHINKEKGYSAVILSGDFNDDENSATYKLLTTSPTGLQDVFQHSKKVKGVPYSFHGFGKKPLAKRRRIDFIFVNEQIKVKKVIIPPERDANGIFLSDHNPIISQLSL